jgi:uncharacterized membrane protein (DUF4010 family)
MAPNEASLFQLFMQFGLAAMLGFLIGLEREMRDEESSTPGIRDFVFFALLGAASGFTALLYDSEWILAAGFVAFLAILLSAYWTQRDRDTGVTTELAAVLTFLLGALIVRGATDLAIALAILAVAVLFPKREIKRFRSRVQMHELRAVLLFLVITFIVLPVLPRQSLDTYLSLPAGTITEVDLAAGDVTMRIDPRMRVRAGESLDVVAAPWERLGKVEIREVSAARASGTYVGDDLQRITAGLDVRRRPGIEPLDVMLSALEPYKIWLIVVLVSGISFVGYALIKLLGSRAGIGLTGLVGGLVSSTVTTLSFAKRSTEAPEANRLFAMAIILASSIMFPRLLLEIAVVNQALMRNIAVPLIAMGLTGFALAYLSYRGAGTSSATSDTMQFDNPFSLKSALGFGLIFAFILVLTHTATTYLGDAWLPAVAIVSGLTDADAIAFSISALHQSGLIRVDWAGFNLVLGAISNTFMKLFLVLVLGDRGLFRQLLVSFLIIGAVGIATMLLYYDADLMFR